jgi:hypothetical protein
VHFYTKELLLLRRLRILGGGVTQYGREQLHAAGAGNIAAWL